MNRKNQYYRKNKARYKPAVQVQISKERKCADGTAMMLKNLSRFLL